MKEEVIYRFNSISEDDTEFFKEFSGRRFRCTESLSVMQYNHEYQFKESEEYDCSDCGVMFETCTVFIPEELFNAHFIEVDTPKRVIYIVDWENGFLGYFDSKYEMRHMVNSYKAWLMSDMLKIQRQYAMWGSEVAFRIITEEQLKRWKKDSTPIKDIECDMLTPQ